MEQTVRRFQSPYRSGNRKIESNEKILKYWSRFVTKTIISAIILMACVYCKNVEFIATSTVWAKAENIINKEINVEEVKQVIERGIEYVKVYVPEILNTTEKVQSMTPINVAEAGEPKGEVLQVLPEQQKDPTEGMSQEEKDIYSISKVMMVLRPVNGAVSSQFGYRTDPITKVYGLHTGTDYAVAVGTQIKSAISGTVIEVKKSNVSLGNYVKIKNSDIITTYAHCSTIKVKEGDKVRQGDIIALSGNTGKSNGPHLHFEITKAGRYIDPSKLVG